VIVLTSILEVEQNVLSQYSNAHWVYICCISVAAVLAKQKQKDEETLASTVAELNIKDSEMATAAAEEQKKMLGASAAAQKTKDDDAAAQVAAEQAILLHDSVARQTQTDREDTAAALALQTRDDEEERVEAVADQKKVDGAAMVAAAIVQRDLVCSDIGGKPDGRLLEAARSVDRRHPGCYDSACEIAGGPGAPLLSDHNFLYCRCNSFIYIVLYIYLYTYILVYIDTYIYMMLIYTYTDKYTRKYLKEGPVSPLLFKFYSNFEFLTVGVTLCSVSMYLCM